MRTSILLSLATTGVLAVASLTTASVATASSTTASSTTASSTAASVTTASMAAASATTTSLTTTSLTTASVAAGRSQPGQPLARSDAWVGTWSAGLTPPGTSGTSTTGFDQQTLREVVHLSLGGRQVRIRLSDAFGSQPLALTDVTVGIQASGANLAPGSERTLTFAGQSEVDIPPGAETFSDPVNLTVPDYANLVVSLYTPSPTGPTTWHGTASNTSYYTAGQHSGDLTGTAFRTTMTSWYFLDGVDVGGGHATGAVVTLGDSITDGVAAPIDTAATYPDDLARRIGALGLSVLNEGINGNRVLTDAGSNGVTAQARFDRDVLGQTGVRTVLLLEGINDIGHDLGVLPGQTATPAAVIAGLRALVDDAHEHGLRIIGATLTPIGGSKYDSPTAEATVAAVNQWIRTSGAFDGVVDFNRRLADPANPLTYLPAYDSGDHLHPSPAGYQAMANAIPPPLLAR